MRRKLRFEQGSRVLAIDTAQESHHLLQGGNLKVNVVQLVPHGRGGVNSLNRISWSCAHLCRSTSMPRPPPPNACISVRSKITTWASVWDVTASRNLRAASVRTNLPAHSMIAISPTLSICTVGIIPPEWIVSSCCIRARTVPFSYILQHEKRICAAIP